MSERIIICPDCLMRTRLNPSGRIRKHLIGPEGSDWCLSSGSNLGQASYFGMVERARGYMEIKEDMNIITVYAPDQIDLVFDEIPDRNWLNVWERSEFPHPLITVDINKEGVPFQIVAMGSRAPKLLELYAEWLREIKASKTDKLDRRIDGDRQILIDRLSAFYHEQGPINEESIRKLQTLVGMDLIGYVADAEPGDKKLQRLRALYRTALILHEEGFGPRTIRAWLRGSNPDLSNLSNRAPIDLLREGWVDNVLKAAKDFTTDG